MKIGNLKLKNNLILAPLAAINDLAFRLQCKKYGAALVYSEMINADALASGSPYANIKTLKAEQPLAIQLFASSSKNIPAAIELVEKKCNILDFNLGCPSYKVNRAGCGASLLSDPKKIFDIISTMSENSKLPVTAKIRIKETKAQTLKIAKTIEKAGASAIAIHGRRFGQNYAKPAEWDHITHVKKNISIPVIGNGDVNLKEQYDKIIKETNCDAVMIGRKAMQDPSIFKQILKNKPVSKKQLVKDYISIYNKNKLDSFSYLKQHISDYTKGIVGGRLLRAKLNNIKTTKEALSLVKSL